MVSIRTLSPVAGFHRPLGAEKANATWASKSAAAVQQREDDALDKIIEDTMTAPETGCAPVDQLLKQLWDNGGSL